MQRRRVMGGLISASLTATALPARAAPANLTLLVAGPAGEQTSRWGNAVALALSAAFPGQPQIYPRPLGGLDGVTGANRLDALVVPDGTTAAIMPGAALTAWLTGDPRVHFDPTRWVPVMAGCGSGVLVVRLPDDGRTDLAALRAISPLRLGADQPQSNDLAALLALARLGVPVAPVFGLRNIDAKTRAFVAGEVDAVFVSGEGVPEDIAPLAAAGGQPVFCLGSVTPDGKVIGDALFPGLPDLVAFSGTSTPFFDAVYRAAAAAARLDFLVVLPRLTDPAAVAQWRGAAQGALAAPALAAAASASSIMLQAAPVTAAAMAALDVVSDDQTGLQSFLAKSYGWQPG